MSIIKRGRLHTLRGRKLAHFLLYLSFSESIFFSLPLPIFLHINFPSKCLNDKSSDTLHPDPTWEAEIIDTYGYNAFPPRRCLISFASSSLLFATSSKREEVPSLSLPLYTFSAIFFARVPTYTLATSSSNA